MIRNLYRPLLVAGLFTLAACSGGSLNSSTPGSQPVTPQSAGQAQTRTTLADTAKPMPKPKPDGQIAYNSIPSQLAPIPSQGFECCQVDEFGDGFNLKDGDVLDAVSFVMDSWGCETGDGNTSTGPNACHTTPGSTFNAQITLHVYALCASTSCPGGGPPNSHVGALLATQTKTFAIPYRPSADPTRCPSDGTFYSDVPIMGEGHLTNPHCTHGLPNTIVFDAIVAQAGAPKNLPRQVISTVQYNTSNGGYSPTGTQCTTRPSDSCGIDSLNVGAEGRGAPAYDLHGAFITYSAAGAGNYCDGGSGGSGYLRLDTAKSDCWGPQTGFPDGLHPQIQVTVYDKTDETE